LASIVQRWLASSPCTAVTAPVFFLQLHVSVAWKLLVAFVGARHGRLRIVVGFNRTALARVVTLLCSGYVSVACVSCMCQLHGSCLLDCLCQLHGVAVARGWLHRTALARVIVTPVRRLHAPVACVSYVVSVAWKLLVSCLCQLHGVAVARGKFNRTALARVIVPPVQRLHAPVTHVLIACVSCMEVAC
jgi:hypothetical protein